MKVVVDARTRVPVYFACAYVHIHRYAYIHMRAKPDVSVRIREHVGVYTRVKSLARCALA